MQDSRNMIIAVVLSIIVLFGWQYFVAGPQMEQAAQDAPQQQSEQQPQQDGQGASGTEGGQDLPTPGAGEGSSQSADIGQATGGGQVFANREEALAGTPRLAINTPAVTGSINLVGARIDDLELKEYHETVDPSSPIISLLSPTGSPDAYFAEQGWVNPGGGSAAVPTTGTEWEVEGDTGTLTPSSPVTLVWDNGEGLIFRRTFQVDENYLFTVEQSVENTGANDVMLYPYARVARHGTPDVQNFFVQHEGPLGVLGEHNLIAMSYGDLADRDRVDYESGGGWLGITDKYWATAVLAEPEQDINARFSHSAQNQRDVYQTSFVARTPVTVPAGATGSNTSYVFAGAKKEAVISSYEQSHGFDRLELLIDWGWLHFLTKPLFYLLAFLYGILGNFGLAILAVTVLVKLIFFPLANRSYASMAAMRRVQPEMKEIQEKHKDDRAAQQKAMMELYKREKINPISGCWPILIQIPVFFALYTVLFISLEMRHAPFFGWVQDLASPDPTNIFTLFGLIPWDPSVIPLFGPFLMLGIWPVIMGITMWVQMKLNPPPPDPTQAMLFNIMPIIFTFMLGTFPAGLVIYWAWNNFLSICQQWVIMKRHGVEVDIVGNIVQSFKRGKPAEDSQGK